MNQAYNFYEVSNTRSIMVLDIQKQKVLKGIVNKIPQSSLPHLAEVLLNDGAKCITSNFMADPAKNRVCDEKDE